MKIKKFNENLDNELMKSHLDDDSNNYFKGLKVEIQDVLENTLYELSASMEEYTTGAEGEIKLSGDINAEFGKYEYIFSIKRVE